MSNKRAWTDKEISVLKEMYLDKKRPDQNKIAKRLKRSYGSVDAKISHLGLKRGYAVGSPRITWTRKMDRDLVKQFKKFRTERATIDFFRITHDVGKDSVCKRIKELGLNKMARVKGGARFNDGWTWKQNDALMIDRAANIPYYELSVRYNKNLKALEGHYNSIRRTFPIMFSLLAKQHDKPIIKHKFGLTEEDYQRYLKRAKFDSRHMKPRDIQKWGKPEVKLLLDSMENMAGVLKNFETMEDEVTVPLITPMKYIMIVPMGDWHTGSIFCDMKSLRRDLNIIRTIDHVYMMFAGDSNDNFIGIKGMGGEHEQIVPLKEQRIAVGGLFEEAGGHQKVLAVASGCHSRWSVAIDDYNLKEHIARKLKVPYLGQGGTVNLECYNKDAVNKKVWRIRLMHKFTGGGNQNLTHACKQYLRNQDGSCDIVMIAHNHLNAIALEDFQGRERCYVRTGAYKLQDRFAKSLNKSPLTGCVNAPAIILSTTEHKIQAARSVSDGVKILKALNGN